VETPRQGALLTGSEAPAVEHRAVRHRGVPQHGGRSGDWLGWGQPASDDGPAEQSEDDRMALCLTSAPLAASATFVGFPALRVTMAVDQAVSATGTTT
jgi:hypothetical protein